MKKYTTAERLKQIMTERSLKQVEILELCKPYCEQYKVRLEKNDLSQYVSGKVEPKQDKLSILGMALQVSEVWLMGYDVAQADDFITLYNALDEMDKAEIRGTIKQMLKADKYTKKEKAIS